MNIPYKTYQTESIGSGKGKQCFIEIVDAWVQIKIELLKYVVITHFVKNHVGYFKIIHNKAWCQWMVMKLPGRHWETVMLESIHIRQYERIFFRVEQNSDEWPGI